MKKILLMGLAVLVLPFSASAVFMYPPAPQPITIVNPTPRPTVVPYKPIVLPPISPITTPPSPLKYSSTAAYDAAWAKYEAWLASRDTQSETTVSTPKPKVLAAKVCKVTVPNVPATVAASFAKIYKKTITPPESTYWKKRLRSDRCTVAELERTMAYYSSLGKSPK